MTPPTSPADVTSQLTARFEELRVAYERFMLGVDRVEPAQARQRLVRDVRLLLARPPNNTAQNFRLQALKSRLLTYEALWDRHTAAREASFGPRRTHAAGDLQPAPQTGAPKGSPDAVKPQQPQQLQQLYHAFVDAQAEGGKAPPSFAAFEAMVVKQMQSIKERTGWQDVGLRVTMNQGRPALQAFNGGKKDG